MTDPLDLLDAPEPDPRFRFRMPVPAAKKNRQQVFRFGKKCKACGKRVGLRIMPSKEAREVEDKIRFHVKRVLRERGYDDSGQAPFFGDHDVRCEIDYRARDGKIEVTFSDAGPRPKGFTGRKRDLANIPEALLDALQRVLYVNDNQISELHLRRIL